MKTYNWEQVNRDYVEDISTEWVPADVARAMYEVLMMIDNDEHSHLSPLAWDRMQDALAAADGEEV